MNYDSEIKKALADDTTAFGILWQIREADMSVSDGAIVFERSKDNLTHMSRPFSVLVDNQRVETVYNTRLSFIYALTNFAKRHHARGIISIDTVIEITRRGVEKIVVH